MHTVYTVKSTDQRKRRSAVYTRHSVVQSAEHRRSRRSAELASTIGKDFNRGTQMMHIKLNSQGVESDGSIVLGENRNVVPGVSVEGESEVPLMTIVIGLVAAVVVIVIIVAAVLLRRRRQNPPPADDKARYSGGKHIVVASKRGGGATSAVATRSSSGYSSSDASEV